MMPKKKRIKRSELKKRARERMEKQMLSLQEIVEQDNHYEIFMSTLTNYSNPKTRINFISRYQELCNQLHLELNPKIEESLEMQRRKTLLSKRKRKSKKLEKKGSQASLSFSKAYGKEGNYFKLIFNKSKS